MNDPAGRVDQPVVWNRGDERSMARARSLSEFQEAFPDEARCAAFLFKHRWPGGFVCPACGKPRAVALKSRPRLFECLDCGRQTSITAGTAMHRSKLPLTTWFWAAHLMATHSNGMSAQSGEGDRLIQPKVITGSGDHDHAREVDVASGMTMRRSAPLA